MPAENRNLAGEIGVECSDISNDRPVENKEFRSPGGEAIGTVDSLADVVTDKAGAETLLVGLGSKREGQLDVVVLGEAACICQ